MYNTHFKTKFERIEDYSLYRASKCGNESLFSHNIRNLEKKCMSFELQIARVLCTIG